MGATSILKAFREQKKNKYYLKKLHFLLICCWVSVKYQLNVSACGAKQARRALVSRAWDNEGRHQWSDVILAVTHTFCWRVCASLSFACRCVCVWACPIMMVWKWTQRAGPWKLGGAYEMKREKAEGRKKNKSKSAFEKEILEFPCRIIRVQSMECQLCLAVIRGDLLHSDVAIFLLF